MDAMRLDDLSAFSVGLPVTAVRGALLVLVVWLTAAVSVAGGIGFIGLIAPHAARLLFGTASAGFMAGAAAVGAGMVMAADLVVRLAFQPLEVPTGAVTALIGAPYFLAILLRHVRAHA